MSSQPPLPANQLAWMQELYFDLFSREFKPGDNVVLAVPDGQRKALQKRLHDLEAQAKSLDAALARSGVKGPDTKGLHNNLKQLSGVLHAEGFFEDEAAAADKTLNTLDTELATLRGQLKKQVEAGVKDGLAKAAMQGENHQKIFKGALSANVDATKNLDALRKLVADEMQRTKDVAALQDAAKTFGVAMPKPKAQMAFDENTAEPDWNDARCEQAFKQYTWFDFKRFRKTQEDVRIKGLPAAVHITDDVMWKLYQYRRKVVDGLIAQLHAEHPKALIFKSSGSEDIESDLDITVSSPGSARDTVAMKAFNDRVNARYGRPPGRVFDTNLYARDYNAIEDNMSAPADRGADKDHAIAEPTQGSAMVLMSRGDQDVATLMKQRRFVDQETFEDMKAQLLDAMPPGKGREELERKLEEADALYLITAKEKVDRIVTRIEDRLKNPGDHPPDPEQVKLYQAKRLQLEAALHNPKAEAIYQRLLPEFLDMLESGFESEVMAATDEQYAERMGKLREQQLAVAAAQRQLEQDEAALALQRKGRENQPATPDEAAALKLLAQRRQALDADKAALKKKQSENIMFANEAYVSQGAITHIVSGKQAANPETRAKVLAEIQPIALVQSCNEQVADFLKDMKHMGHEEAHAEGTAKRRANGEAFVHASKYLARMLEAIEMLQDKYRKDFFDGSKLKTSLTGSRRAAVEAFYAPYPELATPQAKTVQQAKEAIENGLLAWRKSSTVPGDAKAELGVDEVNKLFGVRDIAGLTKLVLSLSKTFNARSRALDPPDDDEEAELAAVQQYFGSFVPRLQAMGLDRHAPAVKLILGKVAHKEEAAAMADAQALVNRIQAMTTRLQASTTDMGLTRQGQADLIKAGARQIMGYGAAELLPAMQAVVVSGFILEFAPEEAPQVAADLLSRVQAALS